jgi:hypothetical protein
MRSKIFHALTLMAVAAPLAGLVQAQSAAPATSPPVLMAADPASTAGDEIAPQVDLVNIPLRDAVTALAKQVNLNIIFDPVLLNQIAPNVNAKWRNVTAKQALQALLENYGWQMTGQSGTRIFQISAREPNAVDPQRTVVNLLEKAQTNAAAADEVAAEIRFDGASLGDAIQALALQVKLNIIMDPAVLFQKAADGTFVLSSKLTKKWKNVTARQALQALLDNWGWQTTQIPGNPIFFIVARNP